jgi:large repetitive protein
MKTKGLFFAALWLLVGQDGTGQNVIVGGAIGPLDVVLDTNGWLPGVIIPPREAVPVRGNPAVASNGRECLVVWEETLRLPYFSQTGDPVTVRAARIRAADGVLLDPTPIALPASWSSWAPAVATDGRDFIVVWEDWTKDRSPVGHMCQFEADIHGARIRASDGAVLDTHGIPISTHERGQGSPAVAFGQESYLVVWRDSRASDCAATDIYAARVHPQNGRVLDPAGVAISRLPAIEDEPSVAFDGRQFVLVWRTPQDTLTGGNDLHAACLLPHPRRGFVPSPLPLCTSAGWRSSPRVVGAEGLSWVVWEQYQTPPAAYGQADLYAARVVGLGPHSRYDAEGFPVVVGNTSQRGPRLAALGHQVLLAWWQGGAVYGVRLRNVPLPDQDEAKFVITASADVGWQVDGAYLGLAGAGDTFIAAWIKDGDVFAARLHGRTLRVLDLPAIQITH